MEYLNGQTILGFFFIVGGAVLVFNRVGIIKMPVSRNGNSKKEITTLKEVQITQTQLLKTCKERLDKGDSRFIRIETALGEINTNVGVLLDRTK